MRSILVLLAIVVFAEISIGQSEDRRLLETERHIVTVRAKGDSVVFTMEAIADFVEDRDNSKPLGTGWDFAGIRVDVNNNNVIDNGIDLAFGTRQKTNIFCSQYLISESANSMCGGYRSKGSVRVDFASTQLQEKPHPVLVYEIPVSDLGRGGGKIGLVFTFADPNQGMISYPSMKRSRSFAETIQLDLSEL